MREVAALDFGSSKITCLFGRKGVNNTLQILGKGEVEYAGFSGGEFLRPELVASVIKNAIFAAENEAGKEIKHLFIGVPSEFCFLKVFESTISFRKKHRINSSDVEVLMQQGKEDISDKHTLINCQPIYYTVDDDRRVINPVSLVSGSLSGIHSYIYVENKFTDFIDSILQNIGVDSAEYVSSILAEALFLLGDKGWDNHAILVDVGYITTSVAVVRGDGLLSLSSFSLGGGHISGDLARRFQISFAEAETLKRKVMLYLKPESDDVYDVNNKQFNAEEVGNTVAARIAVIAKNIKKSLDLCGFEIPSSLPVFLSGGGICYVKGGKEVIQQNISREVEIISPSLPLMEKPHLSSQLGLLNMILEAEIATKKKNKFF